MVRVNLPLNALIWNFNGFLAAYLLQGRYGTVKKCKRIKDRKLFAVKEVRSTISDDFDKACLENQILTRLNLANNDNIVRQVAFYRDLSK